MNDLIEEEEVKVSDIIGQAVWLLLNSPAHKHSLFIADLEWFLVPAILSSNYKIYRDTETNNLTALLLWASVDDEVNAKLEAGIFKLRPQDWNSGKNYWIIEIVSPQGDASLILEDVKESNFKGKSFKFSTTNAKGEREIVKIKAKKK